MPATMSTPWFTASGQAPASSSSAWNSPEAWAQNAALGEANFAAERQEADRKYNLDKDKLDHDYTIAKQNARTNEQKTKIDQWYNQQQVKLAQDRLAQEHQQYQQTFGENQRQFNQTFGEGQRQFDQNFGLNQAKLGYDVLGMAANLRGPENYFQASNFAHGVAGNPQTAVFLDALRNNTGMAGFGAQGGLPQAETMGSMMAKMGGSGSGADNNLAAIHQIGAQGGGKVGAGVWEQLSPTEQKLFMSGLEAPDENGVAFDAPTFFDQMRRSRIGQTFGNTRAA